MRISSIEILLRLFRLGRKMHPKATARDFKKRITILGTGIFHQQTIRAWYEIVDNPELTAVLEKYPLMHGAIYWPYINHEWPIERRLKTIARHYRLLDRRAAILARAAREEVEVAKLEEHHPGLRLVLDKAIWFLREGEIVLNLFLHDRRLFSIGFTLNDEAGTLTAYVGVLQGSNLDDSLQVYREITHALHGMRPRDFLVAALKFLCRELGVTRILAVSDAARQHRSPYFGDSHKEKVLINYDEVWAEHGGTLLDNGFFDVPIAIKHREPGDIPSRKRAMYRRRYQMLEQVAVDTRATCDRHEAPRPPRRTATGLSHNSLLHTWQ